MGGVWGVYTHGLGFKECCSGLELEVLWRVKVEKNICNDMETEFRCGLPGIVIHGTALDSLRFAGIGYLR